MTTASLKKFLVMYLAPAEVLADWAKTDPQIRQAAEKQLQGEWQRWMSEHASLLKLTEAAGKTKAVTSAGVVDSRNDIMLYSVIEAESHDAAAQVFANHPHLTIPRSSIQIMEVRSM